MFQDLMLAKKQLAKLQKFFEHSFLVTIPAPEDMTSCIVFDQLSSILLSNINGSEKS